MTFNKGDRIVFLHAEKTGGTTFHRILCSLFDEDKICPERFEQISLLPKSTLMKYDFFSAHATLQDFKDVPKPHTLITILRDPFERTLSLYDFWRSIKSEIVEKNNLYSPRLAQQLAPAEFFAPYNNWRTKATNRYTELLTGCSATRSGAELTTNFEGRAETAIRALDKFDFVGFTEDLDGSFDNLSRILDIPHQGKLPKLNVTNTNPLQCPEEFDQRPPVRIDRETSGLIELLNGSDQLVYDYALKKFYPEGRIARNLELQPAAGAHARFGRDTNWYSREGQGCLLHGPYCRLRPGNYKATFFTNIKNVPVRKPKADAIVKFDVVSELGQNVIFEQSVCLEDLSNRRFEFLFNLSGIERDIELRIMLSNAPDIEFSNIVSLEIRKN